MDIDKIQLAKNIYAFRTAFNETQEELAHALGLEGKTAVSRWENAETIPSRETLIAIAKHFNTSVEWLLHSDFSDLPNMGDLLRPEKMSQFAETALPVMFSEKAAENKDFKRAYDADVLIHEAPSRKDIPADTLDEIDRMKLYREALTAGVPEAGINFLRILFLIEALYLHSDIADVVYEKDAEMIEDLHKLYLTFGEESKSGPFNDNYEENKNIIEEIDLWSYEIICEMKQYDEWRDYLEFYVAMKHTTGMGYNSFSKADNIMIGTGMMMALVLTDNEYARNYFNMIASHYE